MAIITGTNSNDIDSNIPFTPQLALRGTTDSDILNALDGDDQLFGRENNDILNGGNGNDTLSGGTGGDLLKGDSGNDILDGGADNDDMFGGAGNDNYFVDNIKDSVTEFASEGHDVVHSTIDFTLPANVEDLFLEAASTPNPNLNLSGTGNALDNLIVGTKGNNILIGGAGNDTFFSEGGRDSLLGGDGDDVFMERFGINRIDGGDGFDQIIERQNFNFKLTDNNLTIAEAPDLLTDIFFNIEKVTLGVGNPVADLKNNITLDASLFTQGTADLIGGQGNNILLGGTGNDVLDGAQGDDHMEGGLGDDRYIVDSINDQVIEPALQGGTTDTVVSSISLTLANNLEVLELSGLEDLNGTGNSQDNIISGNRGRNILKGGDGKDALSGDAGNDVLDGGSGNDTLTGGADSDRFVYSTGTAFKQADIGVDTIRDFSPGDAIILNPLTFNTLKSGVGIGLSDASDFAVVTNDRVASTSSAKLVYNSSNGHLFYNPNGAATGFDSGGQFATLENNPNLSANSFILSVSTVLPQSSSSKPVLNGSAKADKLMGTDASGILNGFAGNDKLKANGGDDEVYGGSGNDIIWARAGADYVEGNKGNDKIDLGKDSDVDTVMYRKGAGKDIISNFTRGSGGDNLQIEGIAHIDVVRKGSSTYLHVGDGIAGNKGFGSGQLLTELHGTTGFTANNIELNISSGNQAHLLFN